MEPLPAPSLVRPVWRYVVAGAVLLVLIGIGVLAYKTWPSFTSSVGSGPSTSAAIANRTPWQAMMDYFVQDVCLDKNGNVMMGVSPIDGNPDCVTHRDLLPGERLPYHKEDPHGNGGINRIDEIPVDTGTSLGVVAIKILDQYGVNGKTANVLDIGDGISNIYLQSSTTISAYSTSDANGPTFHVGPDCSNAAGGIPGDLNALLNTQTRVTSDALSTTSGSFLTTFGKVYNPGPCLANDQFETKDNRWRLAYYSYTRSDGTKTPPLETLISNNVGDGNHFERYYQTKELGRTRYEAWQDTANMDAATKAQFQKLASSLAADGGDCATQYEPPPTDSGTWIMFECGEWTSITPPSDMKNGDYPDQWITGLKAGNMTAPLFGLAPTYLPKIDSATPTTFAFGAPTTITLTGNFVPHTAQGQVTVMLDGGAVHAYVTPTNNNTTITYQVDWGNTRKDHSLTGGTHVLHVFDGVSMSNPIILNVTGGKQRDKSDTAGNPLDLDDLDE